MDVIRKSYESKTFIVDNNDNNNNNALIESFQQQSELIVNQIINEHPNVYDAFYLFNTNEMISRVKNVQNNLTRAKINYRKFSLSLFLPEFWILIIHLRWAGIWARRCSGIVLIYR